MQKHGSARQREMGQVEYSCCNTELLKGERAVKQWERRENGLKSCIWDWNYAANFGSSAVTWKSNLIARQTEDWASAKCRAERASLISMEGSSGCRQILHWGHKNREHPGTGMGWGPASRATCAAPTFPHQQAPAVGLCPTWDGSCCCSLHRFYSQKRGEKAINSTKDKEFDGGGGKAGNGFGR